MDDFEIETIDIFYFESGHTFMSSDSFHHQVEELMKSMKNIYDYSDFKTAVREANSRVDVKSMSPSDFSDWWNLYSAHKLRNLNANRPPLKQIKHFRAKRGKNVLQYSLDYSSTNDMEEADFLQVKMKFQSHQIELIMADLVGDQEE